MELSISHSSLRLSATIPRPIKPFSHDNRAIAIKPTTKKIESSNFFPKCSNNKLILPVRLHGESWFSKSLLYGPHTCNTSRACAQAESADDSDSTVLTNVSRFGSACYKFLRPSSMHQTIISTTCLFARVLVENPQLFKWSLLFKSFPGLIAMLLSNAYYNGINQIYDVEIDRINKSYLPIPAGDISPEQAWFLVIFDLVAGLLILRMMNADIITTSIYCLGLLLGTFYSVPPFRFKQSSVATSIVNPLVGGVLHNVGILYATRASLGLPFQWSPPIIFITTFVTLFYLIVTNVKDLADVEGDIKHNIRTFPAIYGPRKVTFICTGILLVNYIGSAAVAICMPQAFKAYIMVPLHATLSLWLLYETMKLDKANYTKEKSANFFQLFWKLLALEFLFYPFM